VFHVQRDHIAQAQQEQLHRVQQVHGVLQQELATVLHVLLVELEHTMSTQDRAVQQIACNALLVHMAWKQEPIHQHNVRHVPLVHIAV